LKYYKIINGEKNHCLISSPILFGTLAFSFSLIGSFLSSAEIIGNPLEVSNANPEHVIGHLLWGMSAGIVSWKWRYFFLTGIFAIVLDADHLIQFFDFEMVSRMGHSIPFAIFVVFALILFSKKDYLLGAVAFGSIFSHMSFDIFIGSGDFPIFVPFFEQKIVFAGTDWIIFQLIAICSIFLTRFLITRRRKNNLII